MKRVIGGLFLICFALSASAQDWAKGRLETSSRHREWFAGGLRILLGRGMGLRLRDDESQIEGRLFVLWNGGRQCRGCREDPVPGLRLLCRERRTGGRDDSQSRGAHESRRQKIRAGHLQRRRPRLHARRRIADGHAGKQESPRRRLDEVEDAAERTSVATDSQKKSLDRINGIYRIGFG